METTSKRNEIIYVLLLFVPLIYLLSIWKTLPASVPMHFDLNMNPDRYGSKWELVFVLPGIQLLIHLMFWMIMKIDPKGKIKQYPKMMKAVRMALTILMCVMGCVVVYVCANQGQSLVSAKYMMAIVCVFFIALGNYLPVIKQNYFLGIRTPWTLENEQVWQKTHKLGGRLFFWGGIVLLLTALFVPSDISTTTTISGIIVLSLIPVVYSYFLYKKGKGVA